MIIGERIRNIREDKDILQQELADAIGINVSVLSRIEKGTRQLRDDELTKIADKLHVSTDYLLGRTDEPHTTVKGAPSSGLTQKEEREIEQDLEDMINSMASAAYESDNSEQEDIEALQATLRAAMIQAKRIAKKKYTPRKYRKD
ncbi:MAG: helix-turn-helix domain-containing protein [Selenomonas sp.]|uniref:helix-turn-helix domain-containing protein n=1 Tax=Selenomonas sp. TaxID=2053611 RepID=UPI0025F9AAE1|nr:helix-turn-helix domain-containing protein [Selenomonas sp.]MCR5440299.1 helix-turn-helix domain-containing protein [Selenomonas sp.]